MTVKELIAELQHMPQDLEIYVSSDGEGNGYSSFGGIYECPTIGEGRDLQALADEDVETYADEGEIIVYKAIIYPC